MIVAVSMVRDEADIIGWTLGHMLDQVDHAIIADNLSTDRTRAILESFGDRVTIVEDNEPGYYQAEKMTRLAHRAGAIGAEWVVPFDADEAWQLPDFSQVTADITASRVHVYVPQPHDDKADPNPITRMRWRLPNVERMAKVCFRYHPDAVLHMGQHDVIRPGHRVETGLFVRHYQYRSLEQVRRKVSNGVGAFNASNLPSLYGSHWRELDAFNDSDLSEWWDGYCSQDLVFDP